MSDSLAKQSTEIQNLSTVLLSTLDEAQFFSHLAQFMAAQLGADKANIFIVKEDSKAVLISDNGQPVDGSIVLEKGHGPAGHVIRTKKPYFSNCTQRDPLFAKEAEEGVSAELTLPIVHEGIVIATLHLQVLEGEREFERVDITNALSILADLKKPLSNIKMYLQAKFLNESLLRQIESKEKEIQENKTGLQMADTYRIQEKQIIGNSDAMKRLLSISDRVSQSSVNVLIEGEKGVGKQMVARRIHCRSERGAKSFVSIDCTALPEIRLEAEIFGEESGDFTESKLKHGLIEAANGGTLFINNIDKLTPGLQSKLVRFLTEGMTFRVNGQMPYKSDVRLIVASSKNIEELIENGEFREDLYYSVNTMSLEVPALKNRLDDMEALSNYFLNLGKGREQQKSLSPCVIKALKEYNWPGNVRELQNVMERAYILSDGIIVERDHLADSVHKVEEDVEEEDVLSFDFTEMTLDELEKRHICLTLDHLGGNKTKTARILGITVKTLYNKLHSYGMIAPKEA